MATATKKHYFVLNAQGQSADRRGAFESAEAARTWAEKNYPRFPAWIVAGEPVGPCKPLDKDGNPVTEG